ncbi:hypothetical protein WICPIJ_000866 [Wickerhamomyces pijperi]|uniref:37S ribosomal protein S17, mitochondrial n=1 Tax=Wickerhamomyces pijperi TaxID=599730 RepID=A0A9P8QCU2_WICPI|nr:hypothetical protein WICPIJ_000866 [Wickerhamomyces pijperi]
MARQNFIGLVVSQGKMNKTVKVQVERKTFNRIINKEIMKRKNFLVHDESNVSREGDIVRIESCRPLSSRKSFAIAEIRKNKGSQFAQYDAIAKERVLAEENEKTMEFLNRRERIEKELSEGSDLIRDLAEIRKFAEGQIKEGEVIDEAKIQQLREKYGIKSWPPQAEVLELELESLREKVQSLKLTIDFVEPLLSLLLSDAKYQEKVNGALSNFSKKPVEELKPAVKKNILRKFLLTRSDVAKEIFSEELKFVSA